MSSGAHPSDDYPHPWVQRDQEGEDFTVSRTITLTPVYTLLTKSNIQFVEYEPGKDIVRLEGWVSPTTDHLRWIAKDTQVAQSSRTWTHNGKDLDPLCARLEQGYEDSGLPPQT